MKAITIILTFIILAIYSCKEDKPDNTNPDSFLEEFVSINVENDSLFYMDTTRITAYAKGKGLKYTWETNSNAPLIPIEGVDSAILFYADPCVIAGPKQIFCTISAENRTEMKVDTVVILE
ncbi:MAG: hypothetical protein JXR58_08335 [Bacteroidales bacterium]|nr:hypothetical protein [Bacteroidales bacterium]